MPSGGPRPGSGRPKGKRTPEQLAEEVALKKLQRRRIAVLDRIFNAQLALAEGCTIVYEVIETKNEAGKVIKREHVIVTDPERIKMFLDEGEDNSGNYLFITTEKPDGKMIVDVMDRAGGRPAQAIEMTVTPADDTRDLEDGDIDSELIALRAAAMEAGTREGATPGETPKEGVN